MVEGQPRPCEECGGTGLIHCCEGLQEQPEEAPHSLTFLAAPVAG
jgi:hypothetical protein